MNNKLISIIVPLYNNEKYISRCLDSLCNQTYTDIEIIVVDDGSTDLSTSIVHEYERRDTRIKLLSKKNEGVSFARNTGLEVVLGDYIIFVDSDDWIEENTCEISLKTIEESEVDVVIWPYVREKDNLHLRKAIFSENRLFSPEEIRSLHRRFVGPNDDEICHPENMDSLCTVWGKLYKTSIIQDNNILFEDIRDIGSYEDGIFNLDYFSYVSKAFYINQYLYHYRVNPESITNKYNTKLECQRKKLYQLLDRRIQKNNWDLEYVDALNNRICIDILGLGINIMNLDCSAKVKRGKLSSMISDSIRIKPMATFKTNLMPSHWKLFYSAAKSGRVRTVYLLLQAIQLIRRRK